MKFSKFFVLALLVGLLSGLLAACGTGSPTAAGSGTTTTAETNLKTGDYQKTLKVGDLSRSYELHLSSAVASQKQLPLVLVFHGGGGQGRGTAKLTGFSGLADQQGFIVAYPDGVDRSWNDGRDTPIVGSQRNQVDDVGFISALIDELVRDYKVDPKRVYATGISNGGIFSHRLACDLSDKIAAFAPVVGSIAENMTGKCTPSRAVPIVMFMSKADPFVPWGGGPVMGQRGMVASASDTAKFWAKKDGCAANPTITQLADIEPKDGTTVSRDSYPQCRNGVEVILYTIEGGGHTWAGGLQYLPESTIGKTSRDINASEVMWQFFQSHPL